jgi:hypothetical protein
VNIYNRTRFINNKFFIMYTFLIVVAIGLFVLFTVGTLSKRKFKGFIEYESFKMGIEAED